MDSTVNTDGTSVGSSSEAGRNTTDTPNTTDTTASTGANDSTGNASADLSPAGAEASTAAVVPIAQLLVVLIAPLLVMLHRP